MQIINLQQLARALGGEVNGDQVRAPGPGHSAGDRSLVVKLDPNAPDGFLVHSFASDDPIKCKGYVRQKAGLPEFKPNGKGNGYSHRASAARIAAALTSAMTAPESEPPAKARIVATYRYVDESGALLFEVVRYEPKTFRQRKPDGQGGWNYKLGDVRRVIYRWPELLQHPDATVFVTEGEKDANRLAELNYCATAVASGTWTEDCIKALAGRDVLILEDNDDAGRKKAHDAAQALYGVAKTVRIVRLPGLPDKGDVSDWLDADTGNAGKLADVCFDAPLWMPSTPPPVSTAVATPATAAAPLPPLPWINMSNWDNEPVPEPEWAVLDRIPLRQVALFSGEGAAGKSTLQLQLSAAHALARDWLSTMPESGPSIFIDAEDDNKVLHRRLAAVVNHYGTTFKDLVEGGLHLLSLTGLDPVLAAATRSGRIEATSRYKQLLEAAGDIRPKMIGIASSANVYAGSEIDRSQVQQFIDLLTAVAQLANGAVVLISHPSLTGIATDTGLSGNTQWHNAVRARFYMKGVKPEAGEQPDSDLREIVFKKNNYGPISDSVVLRYQNGLFLPVPGVASLDRLAREAKAEEVFLELLRSFETQNRRVSDKKSPTYAPAVFAQEEAAKKACLSSQNLADAMRRLFAAGKIWNEPCGRRDRGQFRIALKP